MKETGIIMSGDHPRLILEGKKTQTRRVIKPQPYATQCLIKYHPESDYWSFSRHGYDQSPHCVRCPYGQVGDRLWVRETWAAERRLDYLSPSELGNAADVALWYKSDSDQHSLLERGKWRPSIFMPRWASRILLEITEVRAERLQEITPKDCIAEGITTSVSCDAELQLRFRNLWDSLNAKRGYGWEKNPWVWVIGFKIALQSTNCKHRR